MAYIEIDSEAFRANLRYLSALATPERLAIVLKDNAYGHDLETIAVLSREFGIRHVVVRTLEEAAKADIGFETILVFDDIPEAPLPSHIQIAVNSLAAVNILPSDTHVHLKVDTGMHRSGVDPDEVYDAIQRIISRKCHLAGVFSHSRSSDDLSGELYWQYTRFCALKEQVIQYCQDLGLPVPRFHFANSATLLRYKEHVRFDLVRVGIAAYGYTEMDPVFDAPPLKPILSLWGEKIASRTLPKGARIGYGGHGEMETEGVVTTYDIGYADGFFRLKGDEGYTTPDNERVLGRVSMDNLTATGDAETLRLFDDARPLAKIFNTITYEILVKLSPRIPRRLRHQ